MNRDEDLIKLGEEFDDYAAECDSALRIAMAEILNVREFMERFGERSPFDSVDSRLKTFESTINKCSERGYPLNISIIKERVRDIAGIRIVTPFRDDIETVINAIEHIHRINIDQIKDYVAEPKTNGYMSIHLNTQIQIFVPDKGSRIIPVEIQVRDKAMDLWATVEHVLRYKNDNPSPEVYRQFKAVAEILNEFDRMAMDLRDFDPEIAAENTRSALSGLSTPATTPNTKNPTD